LLMVCWIEKTSGVIISFEHLSSSATLVVLEVFLGAEV